MLMCNVYLEEILKFWQKLFLVRFCWLLTIELERIYIFRKGLLKRTVFVQVWSLCSGFNEDLPWRTGDWGCQTCFDRRWWASSVWRLSGCPLGDPWTVVLHTWTDNRFCTPEQLCRHPLQTLAAGLHAELIRSVIPKQKSWGTRNFLRKRVSWITEHRSWKTSNFLRTRVSWVTEHKSWGTSNFLKTRVCYWTQVLKD